MTALSINGTSEGSVSEDGVLTFSANLKVNDPSISQNLFIPETDIPGQYGSLTIESNGQWIYTLNNASPYVQQLRKDQVVSDVFLVDWNNQIYTSVTISISGKNDSANISGDLALSLDAGIQSTAVGQLNLSDVDLNEKSFRELDRLGGQYGSLSLTANGNATYYLRSDWATISPLSVGQAADDTFIISSVDGTTSPLKVSIKPTLPTSGTSGNDTLKGTSANDTIDGGAGDDTVNYVGNRTGFAITRNNDGSYSVKDNSGAEGTDVLKGIEHIRFSDMSVNLTIQDKAASIPTASLNLLTELYVAFFNRVPDADGLSYWIDQFKSGQSFNSIAESFYNAGVQYSSLTGFSATMSNQDFINVVYRNVLGRSDGADQGGLDYWNGELVSGRATHGSLVTNIINSAHSFKNDPTYGYVANLLDNKIVVANKFSIDLGLTYNSASDSISNSMAIAKAVTPTSTSEAIALIGIPDIS